MLDLKSKNIYWKPLKSMLEVRFRASRKKHNFRDSEIVWMSGWNKKTQEYFIFGNQVFDLTNENDKFSIAFAYGNVKISISGLLEQIKSVVAVKGRFEKKAKSKILASFAFFRLSENYCWDRKDCRFIQKLFSKYKIFNSDQYSRNQTCFQIEN